MAGIIDKVTLNRIDRITVAIDEDRVRLDPGEVIKSGVVEAYSLVPSMSGRITEYTIPKSITDDLFVKIDDLRNDLLSEVNNREILTISRANYTSDWETLQQTFEALDAVYINSEQLDATVGGLDLTNYEIGRNPILDSSGNPVLDQFGNPTYATYATLQEIHDSVVRVDTAQSTFTSEVQAYASTTETYINHIIELESVLDGSSAGAVQRLNTKVGVTETGEPTGLGLLQAVSVLQNQTDGTITGWRQTEDPATTWTTDILKEAHHGDVWFDITVPDAVVVTRYNSSKPAWDAATDLDGVLVDANAYADGKASIYSGSENDKNYIASVSGTSFDSPKFVKWTVQQRTIDNIGDVWRVPYTSTITTKGADPVETETIATDVETLGEDVYPKVRFIYKDYRWSGATWYELQDGVAFANSEAITKLDNKIGNIGADNTVKQYVETTKSDLETTIKTGWEYDTNTTLANGDVYNSGFGLSSNYVGDGTDAIPYTSDFWIKASSFAVKADDGSAHNVFEADSEGVTFNGKVSFNSVTGTENLANIENIPTTYKRASHTLQTIIPETALSLSPLLFILTDSIAGDVYDIEITIETGDGNTIVIEDSTGVDYISFVATDLGEVITTRITLIEPNIYIKRAPYVGSISIIATKVIQEGSTWLNDTDVNNPQLNTYINGAWVENGTPGALTEDTVIDGINANTTTINGGRIDTDSLFSRDITFTGVMTGGGASGVNGIIKSSNYADGESGMMIDLVNGSIYIA